MPIYIENEQDIRFYIIKELQDHLSPLFTKASKSAEEKIKGILAAELRNSPEYYNMLPGGSIYGEIGNPNIERDLNEVIDLILAHISLDLNLAPIFPSSQGLSGSFQLNIIRGDFADILGLSTSSFTTEKGTSLPWLSWLLIDGGGQTLIYNFHYIETNSIRSRTNTGIMVPGGDWQLSDSSGTINDNWITRCMDRIESVILETLESIFSQELNI